MLLPEELLDIVASYLAYRLEPQRSQPPELQPERVTSDILSLSLVSRQLRRICLPFLFLHIKNFEDAKQLGEQCSPKLLLVESAKTLILDNFQSERLEEGHKILCESLPHMKHLSYVDMTGTEITTALLSVLCEHSSVSTILVRSTHDLPKGSTTLDLSKVVIKGSRLISPEDTFLVPWLERGVKVSQLLIRKPELLTDEFGLRTFDGLSELDLLLTDLPVIISWLPRFSSAHPYLRRIRFVDDCKHYFGHHTLPFISSFVEEARNKQLCDAYSITRLVISRTTLSSTSVVTSQEWRVTGMVIVIKSSWIEILSLLHSSFPEIQTLQFRFEGSSTYHIDDVICMLRLFPSLEILTLHGCFKRLHFGHIEPWRNNAGQIEEVPATNTTKAGLLWYISRIAQCVTSLRAFFVYEEAYFNEKYCWGGRRFLEGWLSVSNALGGGRQVVGKLRET